MSSHHEDLDPRTLKPFVGCEPYIVCGQTLIRDSYGKTRMIFDVKRTIMLVIDYPLTLTSRGVYPIGQDAYKGWSVYTDTLSLGYHTQNKEREAEHVELSESLAKQELKLKVKEAIFGDSVADSNHTPHISWNAAHQVTTDKFEQEIMSCKAFLQPQKENPHGDI